MNTEELTRRLPGELADLVPDPPHEGDLFEQVADRVHRCRRRRITAMLVPLLVVGVVTAVDPAWLLSHRGTPPVVAEPASDAAGNYAAAVGESARLMSLVRVPDTAVQISAIDPAAQPFSDESMQRGPSVVRERSWRVNQPFEQTLAWVHAHHPRGLHEGAESTMRIHGVVTTIGHEYSTSNSPFAAPNTAIWVNAMLLVEVTHTDANTSVIHAAASLDWIDPEPLRDDSTGPRIRATVMGGCPGNIAHYVGVINTGDDLSHRLLPDARPTGGLICEYLGFDGHPALKHQTALSGDRAQRIAATVGKWSLGHAVLGRHECGAALGSATILVLSYPDRADVDLWSDDGGCSAVSNGTIAAGGTLQSIISGNAD